MNPKADLTFKEGKEIVEKASEKGKESIYKQEPNLTQSFLDFKGLTWAQFNEKIGMPINTKTGLPTKIYQYEDDLIKDILLHRRVWVKKATGLGITEIIIRFIAWMCTKDDEFKTNQIDVSVVIITGTRTRLSIQIIERIRNLFTNYIFDERETIAYINGAKIEAFPSSSTQTARGLSPFIIFLDEADFFEPNEQEEARTTAERYIIKTDPYIIFISTPNLPSGLFENMEKEEPSIYHKIFLDYTVGLRDGMYTDEEIKKGKESPSFEREYNLKYGVGIGNIFPYELVDEITTSYDLTLDGSLLLTVDPAYGSSKFAVIGWKKSNGVLYVIEATEYERPDPSYMLEMLVEKAKRYGNIVIDSAAPEIKTGLVNRGFDATTIEFNKELTKMTEEANRQVREKLVRIHPSFQALISQLKAVKYNDKGHPDKKQLNFDLGDCFLMGCYYFKTQVIGGRLMKTRF